MHLSFLYYEKSFRDKACIYLFFSTRKAFEIKLDAEEKEINQLIFIGNLFMSLFKRLDRKKEKHLVAREMEKMDQDKILCEKYGILRPTYDQPTLQDLKACVKERLKETKWNPDWIHDKMLIRFAKAFGNAKDGMKAIEEYCEWRLKEDVDTKGSLTTDSDDDIYKENSQNRRVVFPDFFDRCGRPIMLVSVRNKQTPRQLPKFVEIRCLGHGDNIQIGGRSKQ